MKTKGIINSYILPHPPIIIPEVGKGKEYDARKTIDAAKKAANDIINDKPDTIIITTPHGPFFEDYFYIPVSETLEGDMGNFGAPKTKLEFENNLELIDKIREAAFAEGIYSGGLDEDLAKEMNIPKKIDHGTFVPLYFVDKEYNIKKDDENNKFKIVQISLANMPFKELYKFGICIGKAVAESGERVVFLASGDLSHSLTPDAPAGYNKKGEEFDRLLIEYLSKADVESILNLDKTIYQQAAECGLRSFIIMLGAMDGYEIFPEIYSYEGPFGVGYSVAKIGIGKENIDRKFLEKYEQAIENRIVKSRTQEDPFIFLARLTLEMYVKQGKVLKHPEYFLQPESPEELLKGRAGIFVTLKKDGELRGCIGTIKPTRKNIAEEIIHNAISAGTKDPRFYPVEENELNELTYSVDLLKKAEPIKSIKELDVKKYGVIVRAGHRSGLLLPNLEGINTPEEQVSIALQKAGIGPNEKYRMERFEVIRHEVVDFEQE